MDLKSMQSDWIGLEAFVKKKNSKICYFPLSWHQNVIVPKGTILTRGGTKGLNQLKEKVLMHVY